MNSRVSTEISKYDQIPFSESLRHLKHYCKIFLKKNGSSSSNNNEEKFSQYEREYNAVVIEYLGYYDILWEREKDILGRTNIRNRSEHLLFVAKTFLEYLINVIYSNE